MSTSTPATVTPEQRAAYRNASRQLRTAGFQIWLQRFGGHRVITASNRRSERTTILALRLTYAPATPICITSWTFNTADGDRYFPMDQSEQAVAAAIETSQERVR